MVKGVLSGMPWDLQNSCSKHTQLQALTSHVRALMLKLPQQAMKTFSNVAAF